MSVRGYISDIIVKNASMRLSMVLETTFK